MAGPGLPLLRPSIRRDRPLPEAPEHHRWHRHRQGVCVLVNGSNGSSPAARMVAAASSGVTAFPAQYLHPACPAPTL
jgi:hypothetical protein